MIPFKPGLAQIRADICHDCPAPCALQRRADFHADLCSRCPAGYYPADGDCAGGGGARAAHPGTGDRVAAWIEEKLLGPAERAAPAAKPLLDAVRRCAGCAADKARLNGDGGGAKI